MQVVPSYRPKLAFQQYESSQEEIRTDTIRGIRFQGQISHQASGSATCELGKTKVMCTVFGPRPRKSQGKAEFEERGAIDVVATFAPFSSFTPNRVDSADRDLSLFLENALQSCVQLELFPKSVLDVNLTVLEDDGSSYACALLCVSFALAQSGVEMFDLVSAVTLFEINGVIGMDPTAKQEREAHSLCTLCFLMGFGGGKLSMFHFQSRKQQGLSEDLIARFAAQGKRMCTQIDRALRASLIQEEEEFVL